MRIPITKISKAALILSIIDANWLSTGVIRSNIILYATALLSTFCVGADFFNRKKVCLPNSKILRMYFVFGLYAFISGLFIAQNTIDFISHMKTYFANIVVLYNIYYVSEREGSMEWVGKFIELSAVLALFQVLLFPYADAGRISLGPESNSNMVGLLFVMGIFFLIYKKEKIEEKFIWKILLLVSFLYGIVLTGSRNALLAGGLLSVLWVISYIRNEFSFKVKVRTAVSMLILIIGIAVVLNYIFGKFENTIIYSRFLSWGMEEGRQMRVTLYKDAFETWVAHPVFGVGFCQFIFYTATKHISHSTYMEILSCTGLLGFLIFFIPVIKLGLELIKKAFSKQTTNRYDAQMLFVCFLIELFLGIGLEWIYYPLNLMILMYLSWRLANHNVCNINNGVVIQ